ncbi:MAG: calycin-like domain-containing protein [Bacteroidales bacterium]|nr:calycin-like domain-containing protein [Bacteroidales bacterium]
MKKTYYFILSAALLLGGVFASCDKDDEETTPTTTTTTTDVASAVVGSYEGTLIQSVGTSVDTVSATITLTKESASTVKVQIPAYGEGRMAMSAFGIEGVAVAKSNNDYTLTKESYSVTPASTEYKGSLSGTVKGGKLALDYTVTPGAMPMAINFNFSQD